MSMEQCGIHQVNLFAEKYSKNSAFVQACKATEACAVSEQAQMLRKKTFFKFFDIKND